MFAAPSSHKRRRASARGDKSRKRAPGRVVLNVVEPSQEGDQALQAAQRRFADTVEAHPFNHRLSIIAPTSASSSLSTSISSIASTSQAVMARISLRVFLSPEFVTQYIKGASLVALSTGDLESDDVICLDGQGLLILSLTKPTYQTLGLTGRPSRYAIGASGRTGDRKSGPVERYIVEVPLCDPSFVPGKPGWTRVAQCFERWEKERGRCFTFCFAAESGRRIEFPQHVRPDRDGEMPTEMDTKELQDVWVPQLSGNEGEQGHEWPLLRLGWQGEEGGESRLSWDDWTESLSELAEWKALVERDAECIKTYHRPSHFENNAYTVPSPRSPGSITRITLTGFLHPSTILAIEAAVRDHVDLKKEGAPWAMLSCEGFTDSPVRWRSQDPGLGLALGQGKTPASRSGQRAGQGKQGEDDQDEMDEKSDDDSSGSESDDSSDDDDDDDDDDNFSSAPLTGKAARRKRSRQVKRKGHQRKGEAERSASIASAAAAGGQGGAFGWGAVVLGRQREASGEDREQEGARYIWWENVEGDTRN